MSVKKIDTVAIESAATNISQLNNELHTTLENSKSTVMSLNSVWTGQAADATINAYKAFETKYAQEYKAMMEQYVQFLKNIAATGYAETEKQSVNKADLI